MGIYYTPKSRQEILMGGLGLKSWNMPTHAIANTSTLTAGTTYVGLIPLRAGDVVTNIVLAPTIAAGGTAPTSFWVGLYAKSGLSLRISADVKASAAPSVALNALPLSAAYTVLTTDVYYVAVLQVGSWGSTQPSFARNNGNGAGAALSGGSIMWGNTGTGQTGLTAVDATATVSAGSPGFWFGVS